MNLSTFEKDSTLWISGFLILSVLFVFGQSLQHGFISFDDPLYVTQNERVAQGLTLDNVRWAMTAVEPSNWHPLTLLSHMLDVQLFGMRAGLHHLVSVLIHMVNGLLVFFVLRGMTGAVWRSALVAALFALHPLRAESVVWISERKDVLATFFWLLTMAAYARYTVRRTAGSYLAVLIPFALGLASKPMLVTLPCALLLLDYWPLRRIDAGAKLSRLVIEKIPLFLLAIGAGAISVYTQKSSGSMGSLEGYPIGARVANAIVSYGMYLWTTFVPRDLAIIYTHARDAVPAWQIVLAALVLLGVTMGAIFLLRSHPFFAVGWFWFLGTLVPVIGLIQVGSAARADRYMYIPHIGLLMACVWGFGLLVERWKILKRPAIGVSGLVILSLMISCYVQVSYWRNDVTLFTKAVAVSPDSSKAHFSLGIGYVAQGNFEQAANHFQLTVELNPAHIEARKNLGAALMDLGMFEESLIVLEKVRDLEPYEAEHEVNLAIVFYRLGRYDDSVFRAREALRIDPEYSRAHDVIELCIKGIKPTIIVEE